MPKEIKYLQKSVYIRPKLLAKSLERAQNENLSFSKFVDKCLHFYLDNHRDLFDVDTNNICVS